MCSKKIKQAHKLVLELKNSPRSFLFSSEKLFYFVSIDRPQKKTHEDLRNASVQLSPVCEFAAGPEDNTTTNFATAEKKCRKTLGVDLAAGLHRTRTTWKPAA